MSKVNSNDITKFIMLLTSFATVIACSGVILPKENLNNNVNYYNYIQKDFITYIKETKNWLSENREFVGSERESELQMNMPFHIEATSQTDKAILLVHGLNDSPFTFHDIAQDLAHNGFYVQVLLLPGHGSKPQDLFLPNFSDWQDIVYHYSTMLKQNYENVWLGGFSTGANLVTSYTLEHGGVSGLLLFSPAFLSRATFFEHFSKYLPKNIDFRDFVNQRNLVRYESAPFNGLKLYSESAIRVRRSLSISNVTIPTIISISQKDSVVDSTKIKDVYFNKFTHEDSRLIWFGDSHTDIPKVHNFNMNLPEQRISSASHMSITFDENNFYYGKDGLKRICHNGLDDTAEALCNNNDQVWYGAWAEYSNGKVHARLTWNPYYNSMMNIIYDVMSR